MGDQAVNMISLGRIDRRGVLGLTFGYGDRLNPSTDKVLIDPARGVDVGAKSEIYRLCDELAKEGIGLLFTSSEVEETIGMCDRIMVVSEGRVIKSLRRGEASKADVMFWVSGESVDNTIEESVAVA